MILGLARPVRGRVHTIVATIAVLAVVSACASGCRGDFPPAVRGEPWPDANRLFRDDPLWRGGDGAYSVDLGGGRALWLFGDSTIRTSATDAAQTTMVRNSMAVQTGLDPTRAFMRFYWRTVDGQPASFQPEQGPYWFWPSHGIRVDDRLLLFYGRFFQHSAGKSGFRGANWTAYLVENPDDEPSAWRMTEARVPGDEHDVGLATAVLRVGDRLYAYGNALNEVPMATYLARFDVAPAMAGDLTSIQWWTGQDWGDRAHRRPVVSFGASEMSVHFADRLGLYVMVQTAGVAASTLAIRTAPRMEGPWSELRDVLRPPESFYTDAVVYAGKGHSELMGADLVATYFPSSFEELPAAIGDSYYRPFFARLTFP